MTGDRSDQDLVTRAIQGDQRAYGLLVQRYAPQLMQTARSLGLPDSEIDDAIQDTFVAAWKNLSHYDGARPFRGWLFRICINKVRDIARYRRVRRFLFGAGSLEDTDALGIWDDSPDAARQAAAAQQLQHVQSVLRELDRDLREALVLTAIVGLSHAETGVALGTSLKSIEGRVARGRAQLARLIK